MNRAEAAQLLAFCAGNDQRTVGQTDVIVWHDMLAPIPLDRAWEAARRHYRNNPDVWLKPGHIWKLCVTTTDIARGDTTTKTLPDGTQLCPDCKAVHHPSETCAVLVTGDSMWRRALTLGRQTPKPTRANYSTKAIDPPREVSAVDAAHAEAERERQLEAMAAMAETYEDSEMTA